MKGGNAGSGSIEETLREFIHAVTSEITAQLVIQLSEPKQAYATSSSNPTGSRRTFLEAARAGAFKTFQRGKQTTAMWSDVETWMKSRPPIKRTQGFSEQELRDDLRVSSRPKRKKVST